MAGGSFQNALQIVSRSIVRNFVLGVLVTLVVLALAGYVGVREGALPAGADNPPGKLETWAAKTSLKAAIGRETEGLQSPIPADDLNLTAGVKLYEVHCAVCHGASDAQASAIAKGLNIRAPQLAKHGVTDDPAAETFWKVKHGIRFTGMPGFGASLSDTELWQVSLFLSKMDALPPGAASAWKAIPSVKSGG